MQLRESQKKEDTSAPNDQMLEKSRNAVFFSMIRVSVSRKVGSLKRRVRSHVVRGEMKIARRCGEKHILK